MDLKIEHCHGKQPIERAWVWDDADQTVLMFQADCLAGCGRFISYCRISHIDGLPDLANLPPLAVAKKREKWAMFEAIDNGHASVLKLPKVAKPKTFKETRPGALGVGEWTLRAKSNDCGQYVMAHLRRVNRLLAPSTGLKAVLKFKTVAVAHGLTGHGVVNPTGDRSWPIVPDVNHCGALIPHD